MDEPIRGRIRPLPVKAEAVKKLDANINARIHNRFDIEVIDAKSGKVKQKAQAENVICTALWTRLFGKSEYFTYIHYGTGTGTPASTDTSLFTFLGYGTPNAADDVYTADAINGVVSYRRKIILSETTAVGYTLTEVGIGYGTTAATLCTHAMLKDMNGNQISIAKTATDIINIYATVFAHFTSIGDDNGTIRFMPPNSASGIPTQSLTTLLLKGCSLGSTIFKFLFSMLGGTTGYINTGSNLLSAGTLTTDSTNKKLTITATRLAADHNNANGYKHINLHSFYYTGNTYAGMPEISIDVGGTWFSKSTVTGEAIGTGDGNTTDYSTEFNYANNATIYVDGVAVAATVNSIPHKAANNALYGFQILEGYCKSASYSSFSPVLQIPDVSFGNTSYIIGVSGVTSVYYNTLYDYGIATINGTDCSCECSNDKSTWASVGNLTSSGLSIPTNYQKYKYWRFTTTQARYSNITAATFASAPATTNIHFASAPASGAVITADYTTPTIAKNSNYVFDMSVTITLGEYTAT